MTRHQDGNRVSPHRPSYSARRCAPACFFTEHLVTQGAAIGHGLQRGPDGLLESCPREVKRQIKGSSSAQKILVELGFGPAQQRRGLRIGMANSDGKSDDGVALG